MHRGIVKILVNLTVLFSFGIHIEANHFYFKNYKVEDGLSQNTVFCILQDNDGFMWFGTNDGLNRFDGYNFKIYRSKSGDNTLGSSKIIDLVQTSDSTLFIGTANGIYTYNPDKERFARFENETENNITVDSRINDFFKTEDDIIWISTLEQGLFKYNHRTGGLIQLAPKTASLLNHSVSCTYRDSKGNLWISSNGLLKYNPKSQSIESVKVLSEQDRLQGNYITKIIEDSEGYLWIGTDNFGLIRYDESTHNVKRYFSSGSDYFLAHIHDIFELGSGKLLIGSDSELLLFDTEAETHTLIQASQVINGALSDNSIYCFYKDTENGLWLGSYFGGVNYLADISNTIELYQPTTNGLHGKAVSRFCEDADGNVWVATEDGGLNLLDVSSQTFEHYMSDYNIQALCMDKHMLWIGTYGDGLFLFDTNTKRYKSYHIEFSGVSTLHIKSIIKDSHDNIWLGTNAGLYRLDRLTEEFIHYKSTARLFIWDITEDPKGDLWYCTSGNGLFKLNHESGDIVNYLYDEKNEFSLPDNNILTICLDAQGQLWAGSEENGFCKYDHENDRFIRYSNINGFSNRLIYSIIADHKNQIWLSTSNGLFRFLPDEKKVSMFTTADGLQSNQFNFNSGYVTRDGKLYFGGVNGFNAFYPTDITTNDFEPPIRIVNFQLFNKDLELKSNDGILKSSIINCKAIDLKYNQNVISLDYVALSYKNPENNLYQYIMEGFDDEWIDAGRRRRASYTNLPPGEYTFKVKGSNNDWVWNKEGARIKITIQPPFWLTPWAYIIYFIVFILFIYAIMLFERRKHRMQMAKDNLEKEKQMYNTQINFFTNIAHEIRTPLTLIKAPVDEILKNRNLNSEIQQNLKIIDKNAGNLYKLVTELLDFRRVEKGFEEFEFSSHDIIDLIHQVILSFQGSAKSRHISINVSSGYKELYAEVNRSAIEKVLMNLFSNALKYADSEIKVLVSLVNNGDSIQIKIQDNGDGVPESIRQSIFEPFVHDRSSSLKNKDGIGLGLPYAQSLIKHHGGLIELVENGCKGACFMITLPVKKTADIRLITDSTKNKAVDTLTDHPGNNSYNSHSSGFSNYNLLIVEDQDELREFLGSTLSGDYKIHLAADGLEALEILDKTTIDLVITDIMMPNMNGFELTDKIKTTLSYSHIPVIMLTAKTTEEAKIEGYGTGADAYIDKPFSIDLLRVRIINIFENRRKLRDSYLKIPLVKSESIAGSDKDTEFIEKVKKTIEAHLLDSNFGVDQLAEYLNMSRSAFFAKIKGISDLSPLDYIKVERLKKAVEYLQEDKYKWVDIAQMVGYSTPSYFSREFKKQFGVLPRDFKKQL
ncbi:two-component regulator propeller domain-containing protein [Saccharicrinis sp. FJH62]|uniref:hybrid sensor histidine kinase/response regulator transcription factor n=1 Tax=Saccharicrinis sp. FJH62 TaxID=3344657 RepID=UPI0035D4D99A